MRYYQRCVSPNKRVNLTAYLSKPLFDCHAPLRIWTAIIAQHMTTLLDDQARFALMAARLILHADDVGYQITLGDAYRDPRAFGKMGQKGPYGRKFSAHKQRLALDLNLFKGGEYLDGTEAHRPLGEWWEAQGGAWGGRFEDGNHYSLEYRGIK